MRHCESKSLGATVLGKHNALSQQNSRSDWTINIVGSKKLAVVCQLLGRQAIQRLAKQNGQLKFSMLSHWWQVSSEVA